jgi:hypothetical protein
MAKNELETASELPRDTGTETRASFSGAHLGFFRGLVVARNDPDNQNRIKIALPHVYGDIPIDELPWVYPCSSSWPTSNKGQNGAVNGTQSGQTGAGGSTNVPPLGSPVIVAFEGGDHRYPMYFGGAPTKPAGLTPIPKYTFSKNPGSPDNYSYTTPNGSMVQIDNRPGAEKIIAIAPTGDYVSISQAGLIEVKGKKTVSIKGAELVSIDCDSAVQMRGNKVILYSSGDLVVEGASSVNVNSNSVVNIQASQINLNCGSSQTAKSNLKEVDTTPTFDGS